MRPYLRCLLFALAGFFVLPACKHQPKQEELATTFSMSDTMMARCRFTAADEQQVRAELKLFGKVSAENNRQAQLHPAVGGVVIKINAEVGDAVKQGEVLATVRSSDVAQYQKDFLDAQSDLAVAEKNVQVAQDLYAGKINSEKDVLAARQELKKARAALSRIEEIYHIYSLSAGSIYNITAPITGFIVSRSINRNEQIRVEDETPVFAIAQIDEVWVLANVNESDIAKVHEGVEADIQTISYPDRTYKGKVDKIFNVIDPATRAMKIRVAISNEDLSLKPDMNATVTLHFNEDKRMVAVPSSAVIFDNSRYYVMVFKSRTNIETRPVEIYRQLGATAYIQAGLADKEKVISQNGLMIYDALND